jgi:hypothetical protein
MRLVDRQMFPRHFALLFPLIHDYYRQPQSQDRIGVLGEVSNRKSYVSAESYRSREECLLLLRCIQVLGAPSRRSVIAKGAGAGSEMQERRSEKESPAKVYAKWWWRSRRFFGLYAGDQAVDVVGITSTIRHTPRYSASQIIE